MKWSWPLLLSISLSSLQAQPLSLQDCIRLAIRQNQPLKVQKYYRERALAQARASRSIILPRVDLNFNGSNTGAYGKTLTSRLDTLYTAGGDWLLYPSGFSETGPLNLSWNQRYSLGLNLSQNLYDGGRWYHTLKTATLAEQQAELEYRRQQLATIFLVKQAFFQYLSTVRLLDVYRENLKAAQERHRLVLERHRLGAAAPNDTLRTLADIARTRIQILNTETDLADKRRSLNRILGRDEGVPLQLKEPLWTPIKVPTLEEVWQTAQKASPELLLAKLREETAQQEVAIARAAYLPSLSLNLGYSSSAGRVGDLFARDNMGFTGGISLSLNLFDGRRKHHQLAVSRMAWRATQETYSLTAADLRKDIAQTLEQLRALQEAVRLNQLLVDATLEDYVNIKEQYRVGSAALVDVLSVGANLENAQAALIQARYQVKITQARLEQLIGGVSENGPKRTSVGIRFSK